MFICCIVLSLCALVQQVCSVRLLLGMRACQRKGGGECRRVLQGGWAPDSRCLAKHRKWVKHWLLSYYCPLVLYWLMSVFRQATEQEEYNGPSQAPLNCGNCSPVGRFYCGSQEFLNYIPQREISGKRVKNCVFLGCMELPLAVRGTGVCTSLSSVHHHCCISAAWVGSGVLSSGLLTVRVTVVQSGGGASRCV